MQDAAGRTLLLQLEKSTFKNSEWSCTRAVREKPRHPLASMGDLEIKF